MNVITRFISNSKLRRKPWVEPKYFELITQSKGAVGYLVSHVSIKTIHIK